MSNAEEVPDFLGGVLKSSTEYSIIGKDLDGKILLWNEGARRIYGYESEEVVGRANAAILHTPEDIQAGKPREMFDAALRDGKWEGTIKRVRKNGQQFTARVVITPRRDATGRPTGFLLISKDISDEIRLAEQLEATKLYTRLLIESNIDALMTTDPLGIITDVNRQMVALTGSTRDELIGSPFKDYFTDPERAEEGIRMVLREGKVTNYELTAPLQGRPADGGLVQRLDLPRRRRASTGRLRRRPRHHRAEAARTKTARVRGVQPWPDFPPGCAPPVATLRNRISLHRRGAAV